TMSPGASGPMAAMVGPTAFIMAPRCTGTCSAWATSCAWASKMAHEASMRSLMFGENEVIFRTVPISWAVASRALRSTSSVTGSNVLMIQLHNQATLRLHGSDITGIQGDGGRDFLDDGRPCNDVAREQGFAAPDGRLDVLPAAELIEPFEIDLAFAG